MPKYPSQMAISSGALFVCSFWCHCSMNLHSIPAWTGIRVGQRLSSQRGKCWAYLLGATSKSQEVSSWTANPWWKADKQSAPKTRVKQQPLWERSLKKRLCKFQLGNPLIPFLMASRSFSAWNHGHCNIPDTRMYRVTLTSSVVVPWFPYVIYFEIMRT